MKLRKLTPFVFLFFILAQPSFSQEAQALEDPSTVANNNLLKLYASYFGKSGLSGSTSSFSTVNAIEDDYELVKNYIIQLGAFKNPDFTKLDRMRKYGTLYTEPKGNLTIYKLGFFLSKLRAEEVLGLAENEGFTGAFLNEITVRKKKLKPVATVNQVTAKSPDQHQEITEYFKRAIKRDLTLIKNELAQTGRYRINKIIKLLKIPLSYNEKQRFAASEALFYPERSTLSKVYSYRTITSILFKSKFSEIRSIGPVFEANVIDLSYSDKGYSDAINDQLKKQIEDLKAMIQVNDNKGLKLNQILDKALQLESLIKQL